MKIFSILLVALSLISCDCVVNEIKYTAFSSHLNFNVYLEFRYNVNNSSNKNNEYIYFNETIEANTDTTVDIKTDKVNVGVTYMCYVTDSTQVADEQSSVQFNLSALSQVTICDTSGYYNDNSAPLHRYYVYPLNTDCGKFRKVEMNEGYWGDIRYW